MTYRDLFLNDAREMKYSIPPEDAFFALHGWDRHPVKFGEDFWILMFWNALCWLSQSKEKPKPGGLIENFLDQIELFSQIKDAKTLSQESQRTLARGRKKLLLLAHETDVPSLKIADLFESRCQSQCNGVFHLWQALETAYIYEDNALGFDQRVRPDPNQRIAKINWTLGSKTKYEKIDWLMNFDQDGVWKREEHERILLRAFFVCHSSIIQEPKWLPSHPEQFMKCSNNERELLFLESAFTPVQNRDKGRRASEVFSEGITWIEETKIFDYINGIKLVCFPPYYLEHLNQEDARAQVLIFTPLGMFVQEFVEDPYLGKNPGSNFSRFVSHFREDDPETGVACLFGKHASFDRIETLQNGILQVLDDAFRGHLSTLRMPKNPPESIKNADKKNRGRVLQPMSTPAGKKHEKKKN